MERPNSRHGLPGTPSSVFSMTGEGKGCAALSAYLAGVESMVGVLQAGWEAVGGKGEGFEVEWGEMGEGEREILARKLWNTVSGALGLLPEKTKEAERVVEKLNAKQSRRFKNNGDGTYRLLVDEDVHHSDCESVGSDDTAGLNLPMAVSEHESSPGSLSRFRFGEQLSFHAKHRRMQPNTPGQESIPELVVDHSQCTRYDSFCTIMDHEVVETDFVKKSQDDDGNKMINDYVVLGDLGSGSFAKVKLVVKCNDPTTQGYALKIVNKDRLRKLTNYSGNRFSQLKIELAIMKKIAHPRVVKLHEVIDDPAANKIYFLLDYINGGVVAELDSSGKCDPVQPSRVSKYLKQLVSALSYLHRNNIIHRDIKPSNILVDKSDNCYLCDFGVSAMISDHDDVVAGLEGTPFFLSPELCEGSCVHGKAADIWGLGVSVYAMIMGRVPFDGTSSAEIMNKIQNEAVVIPITTDPDVRNLLRGMMNKSPKKRMTCEMIKVHPFVVCEGARHPSFEGAAINITRDDVLNALLMGNVGTQYPQKKDSEVLSNRAKAYIRRYTATIQTKVRMRRTTLAREERHLLGITSPTNTPLAPSPPALNPVNKRRRFTPSGPDSLRPTSPMLVGSLASARHSAAKSDCGIHGSWFTEYTSSPSSPELLSSGHRHHPRSLGSLSSNELDTLHSTPASPPLRDLLSGSGLSQDQQVR